MIKHGKKYRRSLEQVKLGELLSPESAAAKVKAMAYAKFNESVDAQINLGIDPTNGAQQVRGSVVLPHGTGKKVRVIVFAKGDHAEAAKKAGADHIGMEDLIEKIEGGWMDFDFAIATPDVMGAVGRLAKLLGPRGLLPNKKLGTVTFDVAAIVTDLKKGRAFFKNDKNGIVHFSFGKTIFTADQLRDNLIAFIKALLSAKPASSKGKFFKKVTISSTMGPGCTVNPNIS